MLDIDLVVGDELVEPETKRGDIVDQINGAFLEGDEHAGFVAFPSAMNEKRRGEQRLAATGRAADQCGAPRRQAAQREIVKSLAPRSEEHTSELQSLMRTSYAVFCLKKQKRHYQD